MNKRFREEPEEILSTITNMTKAEEMKTLDMIVQNSSNRQAIADSAIRYGFPKDLTVTTATQAINKVGTEAKAEFQKVGSGYSGEGHEGGTRIPDTVVPRGTYDGQNLTDTGPKPPAPPVQGFFATMWDNLSQMVSNAAGNVTNFFKQKNDAGELTEDPNYYRIAGVTVFFALMVLGIYKLIKWFKLRKEEQTVETFNQSYKEYKTQIKENINFFNSLNKKFLKEDVEQSQNATVNKALDLAPQVATYALEANEKKEETNSIFKKYGYWILGAIAGFVVIGLYAYYGYRENALSLTAAETNAIKNNSGESLGAGDIPNPTQTAIDLSTRTDGKIR